MSDPSEGMGTRTPTRFGRAPLNRSSRLLLFLLRGYAIVGVLIALYAFFHSVR